MNGIDNPSTIDPIRLCWQYCTRCSHRPRFHAHSTQGPARERKHCTIPMSPAHRVTSLAANLQQTHTHKEYRWRGSPMRDAWLQIASTAVLASSCLAWKWPAVRCSIVFLLSSHILSSFLHVSIPWHALFSSPPEIPLLSPPHSPHVCRPICAYMHTREMTSKHRYGGSVEGATEIAIEMTE